MILSHKHPFLIEGLVVHLFRLQTWSQRKIHLLAIQINLMHEIPLISISHLHFKYHHITDLQQLQVLHIGSMGHRWCPPQSIRFFCFYILIFRKVAALNLNAPLSETLDPSLYYRNLLTSDWKVYIYLLSIPILVSSTLSDCVYDCDIATNGYHRFLCNYSH